MTRHTGDDYKFVKVVADKIIETLLISLMNGLDGEKVAEEMVKSQEPEEIDQSKCNSCEKMFKGKQGLTHQRMHGTLKTHPAIMRTIKGKHKNHNI